jgi:hypothetical protein
MTARPIIPLRPDPHAQREAAMTTLTRSVITAAHGQFHPNVTSETFVRRRWGGTETEGIAQVLRAASAPAMTSTAGWAKELSPITTAFLANLVPFSAGADLLQRGLQLSLDGVSSITIPNLTAPLADFITQGQPIPVVQGTSSVQTTIAFYKFACIVVLTRETVENSNSEALTRQALLDAMGPSLDRRLFDSNAAVADLRPAGLLFNKTPIAASTDPDKLLAMVADLSTLAAAVAPLAGNGNIVFVTAPKQSVAIKIGLPQGFPYPALVSTSLAAGTVIAIATPALISALGAAPQLDVTRAATMHMDTQPSAIASGGTMPSPTTVTFQTDKTGIRLRWPISWALRDANAIAHMTAVTWP